MKALGVAFSLVIGLANSAAFAATLIEATAAGTGCWAGSVEVNQISADTLEVVQDPLELGWSQRANCAYSLSFKARNEAVAIDSIEVEYDSSLGGREMAVLKSYAYVQGQTGNYPFESLVISRSNQSGTQELLPEFDAWTPCGAGRAINLNLSLESRSFRAPEVLVTPKYIKIKTKRC